MGRPVEMPEIRVDFVTSPADGGRIIPFEVREVSHGQRVDGR